MWKWAAFVLCEIGKGLPLSVVGQEVKARDGLGMRNLWTNGDGDGR